jgi:hypothetical protein
MPVTTRSAHAIADPDFARAIARFAADERAEVAQAVEELEAASPFKAQSAAIGDTGARDDVGANPAQFDCD